MYPAPLHAHAQNSVDKPIIRSQNKHLKPFKSRAELGGKLDPRINIGGRPKFVTQACHRALAEPCEVEESVLENGRIVTRKRIGTRADKIALRLVKEASRAYQKGTAMAQFRAAEELRQVVESCETRSEDGLNHSIQIAMNVVKEIAIECASHGAPDDELEVGESSF